MFRTLAVAVVSLGSLFIPAPHMHTPVSHRAPACEKVQIEVRAQTGMPAAYQLTLCGAGIPADTIVCPTASTTLPAPGATLACRLG